MTLTLDIRPEKWCQGFGVAVHGAEWRFCEAANTKIEGRDAEQYTCHHADWRTQVAARFRQKGTRHLFP